MPLLLLLLVTPPSSRGAPSLVLRLLPPGLYTSLHLLPLLMLVGLCGWSQSLQPWLVMLVTSVLGKGNALLLQSMLLWVPAEQDALSLLMVVSAPSSRIESSFGLRVYPPGSYTILGSSPVLKLWLQSLLLQLPW